LRLLLSGLPKQGWITEFGKRKLTVGNEISVSLLSSGALKYEHDDSETTADQVPFSLWLETAPRNGSYGMSHESTWLANVTLPIIIVPVNDQRFKISPSKGHITPVVQVKDV